MLNNAGERGEPWRMPSYGEGLLHHHAVLEHLEHNLAHVTDEADCSIILTFATLTFFDKGTTNDCNHSRGHSLVCQILWQLCEHFCQLLTSFFDITEPAAFPVCPILLLPLPLSGLAGLGGSSCDGCTISKMVSSVLIGALYSLSQYSVNRLRTSFCFNNTRPCLSSVFTFLLHSPSCERVRRRLSAFL